MERGGEGRRGEEGEREFMRGGGCCDDAVLRRPHLLRRSSASFPSPSLSSSPEAGGGGSLAEPPAPPARGRTNRMRIAGAETHWLGLTGRGPRARGGTGGRDGANDKEGSVQLKAATLVHALKLLTANNVSPSSLPVLLPLRFSRSLLALRGQLVGALSLRQNCHRFALGSLFCRWAGGPSTALRARGKMGSSRPPRPTLQNTSPSQKPLLSTPLPYTSPGFPPSNSRSVRRCSKATTPAPPEVVPETFSATPPPGDRQRWRITWRTALQIKMAGPR